MRLAAFALTLMLPSFAGAEGVREARYTDPTTRYAHGVLGDAIEWGALEMRTDKGRTLRVVLPDTRVFEDLEPRLADLDRDGWAEVIVVESDSQRGAQLAVYGPAGKIAATPFIGRSNRWLAPVGSADFDGDGAMEVAYVDRPHLARVLRVWRFTNGNLFEVAALEGVTNHRIGENFISGGVRDCGDGPEMLVSDAEWRAVQAVSLQNERLIRRALNAPATSKGFAAALACRD